MDAELNQPIVIDNVPSPALVRLRSSCPAGLGSDQGWLRRRGGAEARVPCLVRAVVWRALTVRSVGRPKHKKVMNSQIEMKPYVGAKYVRCVWPFR